MRKPDLILENARIHTMDPEIPLACSVAIAGRRVMHVQRDAKPEIAGGPRTKRIDLEGRLLMPGFWDSHFHYYQWAMGRMDIALDQAKSFTHCMQMIRAKALEIKTSNKLLWVQGQGFNESDWPDNRTPLRQDLDDACPDIPVLIWRCDLHLAVANSMALELSGLADDRPDPIKGLIGRDERGRLDGILREEAINIVKRVAPEPDLTTTTAIMGQAQSGLHALGITGVHDVRLAGNQSESALTFRAWQALRQNTQLKLRCWTSLPGEERESVQRLGLRTGLGDEYLRVGHLKYFMDGGMGARTAWMLEPYLDTGTNGLCLISPEAMLREVIAADQAGLAVMVHAIGDRTCHELITVFENAAMAMPKKNIEPALSHRIEHVQVIRENDLTRLARLGMPVSVQPANMLLDINMIDQCAGKTGRYAYNFGSMTDAGIDVMFSSDCPVCTPNPLVGIQAAVTRARNDKSPDGGWYPEQKVSLDQALAAYTSTPARAYKSWNIHGSITAGKFADMVVFEDNLFKADVHHIHRARVAMTIFDGKIVYQADHS
ncbi:amidohydrolase [Desulfonatronovibrio magnus]|uniref:amidohydrolase n=1 Tax=Desulfonatronovibrio magnus TaxID=698827 RepID=UPI0005EB50EB|nr:amidohydrolase [Desulfonatronovibrio magnus]